MSKVAITGNASGTGTFTIAAPNSDTDRQLTLPDEAGTVVTETGLPALTKTNLNATGTAPIYACRAWVNFNGTGTVAIRAAGNVSSITDNGTGDYSVNFTTDMSDINYCATGIVGDDVFANSQFSVMDNASVSSGRNISFFRFRVASGSSTIDTDRVNIAIFR